MALLDLIGLGTSVYNTIKNNQNRSGSGSVLSTLGTSDCSVDGFLSKFQEGFATPNRYRIELVPPPGILNSGSWMNQESASGTIQAICSNLNAQGRIQIACHTLSMPRKDFDDMDTCTA